MSGELTLLPLLLAPAAISGVVYFLRIWERAPQVAAFLASVLTAYFVRALPPGASDDLLGRTLTLDPAARDVMLIVLAAAALSNLALAFHPLPSLYPSASLASASLLGLTATLDNFTLASLCLLAAAAVVVMAWQPEPGSSGHLQYLAAMALGALALAYTASLMDDAPDTPSRLALIGFELGAGLLLGLIPFGFWESSLGRDSEPITVSCVSLSFKPATLLLLWRLTSRHIWLSSNTLMPNLLEVAAVVTVGYAALRAASASSTRTFVAAASQGQFALVVFALLPSLGSSALLPLTTRVLLARVVPIVLLAVAGSALPRLATPSGRFLLAFSVLALLGLPGTPLFPHYLTAAASLPQADALLNALVVLGAGLSLGVGRLASQPPSGPRSPDRSAEQDGGKQLLIAASFLALLAVYLGVDPSRLLAYLQ